MCRAGYYRLDPENRCIGNKNGQIKSFIKSVIIVCFFRMRLQYFGD